MTRAHATAQYADDTEMGRCFKHGCYSPICTWEAPPGEHPDGLCRAHAQRPATAGSIDSPTQVKPCSK